MGETRSQLVARMERSGMRGGHPCGTNPGLRFAPSGLRVCARRAVLRALGGDRSALPRYSYSRCQTAQSSSLPPRVAAPGLVFFIPIRPDRGAGGAPVKALSVWCRALQARRVRPLVGTLASRRSTVAVFGRGPRFRRRHFLRSPCSDAPRSQVVVPGGRGPGPPGAERSRHAAAGRHSPLRLWRVSGDAPQMSEDSGL